jgi:hypothetical protein
MDVDATGWAAGGSLMQVGNAHLTNRSTRPPSGRRVTSIVGQRSEEGFVRGAERLRASYLSALAESFTLRLNSR